MTSNDAADHSRARMAPGLASRLDLLAGTASEFGIDDQAAVWAVVVDMSGMAVAVLDDGTATLYQSADQSAPGHECHEKAAHRLCAAAPAYLGMTAPSRDFKVPATGRVRFFFLTPRGPRATEARIDDLEEERHPLHHLFLSAQQIFYEPRVVPEAPDATCSR